MKRFMAIGLAVMLLITGMSQLASAKVMRTELFAFDETIKVFDKTTKEEVEKTNIASGSRLGLSFAEGAQWAAPHAKDLSASVVSGEGDAIGDAFQIHYEKKFSDPDIPDYLRIDNTPVEYADITEENPVILEFRVKTDWAAMTKVAAWIDIAPIVKPASGSLVETYPFTQQSVQTVDKGKWIDVKYVIKPVTINENDRAVFTFERYLNSTKQNLTDAQKTKVIDNEGTGAGAKLNGFRIQVKERSGTEFGENGYMDFMFDSIKVYREEDVIPTGTRWGGDLTINGENHPGIVLHATVIGDNNTVAEYRLENQDGTAEGYSAEISEDNSTLTIKNVSSTDGYKSKLIPILPKTYTAADIPENGALVYEAQYKLDYTRNTEGNTSYSAVQMYFDFKYNGTANTMQFPVPANTVQSGENVNVKIIIPKGVFDKSAEPQLFANDIAIDLDEDKVKAFSANLTDVTFNRVALYNRARTDQNPGDDTSAVTLALDYLDLYVIDNITGTIEWGECTIQDGKAAYEIKNDTALPLNGTVYAAVYDKDAKTLRCCNLQSATVPANGKASDSIEISGLENAGDVVLFFWNDENMMPYTEKKPVQVGSNTL